LPFIATAVSAGNAGRVDPVSRVSWRPDLLRASLWLRVFVVTAATVALLARLKPSRYRHRNERLVARLCPVQPDLMISVSLCLSG